MGGEMSLFLISFKTTCFNLACYENGIVNDGTARHLQSQSRIFPDVILVIDVQKNVNCTLKVRVSGVHCPVCLCISKFAVKC